MEIRVLLFCLLLTCTMAFSQERTLFGTITDASGKPFAGVVVIKGTTSGTVTSSDGNYSIKFSPNAILMFSFVGLKIQQTEICKQSRIDISLKEKTFVLDEVVAIGYGVQI